MVLLRLVITQNRSPFSVCDGTARPWRVIRSLQHRVVGKFQGAFSPVGNEMTARPRIASNRHSDLIHRFPTLGVLVHPCDETVFLCVAIVEQNPGTELHVSSHDGLLTLSERMNPPIILLVSDIYYCPLLHIAAPLQTATVLSPMGGKCVRMSMNYSCRTTVSKDLLILISPLYSMKPSFLNLFMNILTRERVVPIISASVS